MYQLILIMSLFPTQGQILTATPITTCQWPNTCTAAAPITTCQWPNTCTEQTPITTCQWPNTCAESRQG